jgi:hypothetical protein
MGVSLKNKKYSILPKNGIGVLSNWEKVEEISYGRFC